MFKTASDRQHHQRREGSHSTKAAANGMVPWAKDEYQPGKEKRQLMNRARLLRNQRREIVEAIKTRPLDGRGRVWAKQDWKPIHRALKTIDAELKAIVIELAHIKGLLHDLRGSGK